LHPSKVVWTTSGTTFTEYNATPGNYRGFCTQCGSSLSWRSEQTPDEIEILTGTVDEEWLIGDRTARVRSEELSLPGSWKDLAEDETKRRKNVVESLCVPKERYWERNAIVGVTDQNSQAIKFIEASDLGSLVEGNGKSS
jgi:hypothetical protein